MAKWIELNNGELVDLDNVWNIYKSSYEYSIYYSPGEGISTHEHYDSEEKRDRRFEEIRAMLIGE